MLVLLSLLALVPLPAQQGLVFDNELDVVGTVSSVVSPLAAPLDGVVAGDSVLLHFEFVRSDSPCTTVDGLAGRIISQAKCSLDIGPTRVGLDPMTALCFLGQEYDSTFGTVRTEAAADLEAGLGSAELELLDPGGVVGISVFDIIANPLVVADVTDPGFHARFEIRDPSGGPGIIIDLERIDGLELPYSICDVEPNSTGVPARIHTRGSQIAANNDFVIGAVDLPPSSFALFLVSRTTGLLQNPGNSAGNLCISGDIGRFSGPGQILATGTGGPIDLSIDLTALPQPFGPVAVMPPEAWYFTVWYRDLVGATASNFGATVRVTFY